MNEARCPECGKNIQVLYAPSTDILVLANHYEISADNPGNRSPLCAGSGQSAKFDLPEYVKVLFLTTWAELERSFTRKAKRDFCEYSYTLEIDGLSVRPYYDTSDAPNFVFGGVSLWWYKRPGRSMETSVNWTPEQWVTWFDACMMTVRDWENLKWTER
jgi:hypothetical protein